MADFTVRSDSVDVEQIMRQIRARIREKRGADYTEAELRELATVKLEKFLDPSGVRSDLVDQFRRQRVASPELPKYAFEDTTMYETHRGALRFTRKLLHPLLKLFINPNPLIQAMHVQAQVNEEIHKRFRKREEMDPLYYEVVHNLVMEVTRLGIDVHNMKMRVESLSSRLDFNERRGRSLESVVEYRQNVPVREPQAMGANVGAQGSSPQRSGGGRQEPRSENYRGPGGRPQGGRPDPVRVEAGAQEGVAPDGVRADDDGERRRRRRRRRRRPGQTFADNQASGAAQGGEGGQREGGGTAESVGAWLNEGGATGALPGEESGRPAKDAGAEPTAPAASEPTPAGGATSGSSSRGATASGGGTPRPFDEAQGRPEPVEGRATTKDADSDQ